MKMIKFPSIEQFRSIVRDVKYQGKDENGNPIMDKNAKMPTLTFTGTVKLHGCFEKNTKITLANGEEEKISNLKEGTYVLCYNEKTNKNDVKKIKKVINQKLNKEWCKLIFDKTEIICTKDHKIWTENRGYVEAYKLDSKDIFKPFS